MSSSKRIQRTLIAKDDIRGWAEERKARPACVKGTDQWFRVFEQRNLALIVEDRMADGKHSNFNKLVSRDTAQV